MNFNDLKISSQLRLGFGLLMAMMLVMGGVTFLNISVIESEVTKITDDRYAKIAELVHVKDNADVVVRALYNMGLHHEQADVRKEIDALQASRKSTSQILDKMATLITSDEGKRLLERMTRARSQYAADQDRYMNMINSGQPDQARAFLLNELRSAQKEYLASLDALVIFQESLMQDSSKQAKGSIDSIQGETYAVVGVAIVMAFLLAAWIIRSITVPVNRAVDVARAVAGGDLSHQIEAHGNNETAQLLKALRDMQDSLVKVVSNVRQNAESVATA
ncbi:MAG: hypothetical protein RJA44_1129, partial [Pseudomonadota bacterium]